MNRNAELISAYLDRELNAQLSEEVEQNIRQSDEWRKEYEFQQEIKRIMTHDPEILGMQRGSRVFGRIQATLRSSRMREPIWRRRIAVPVPIMAAAACLLIALALYTVYQKGRSPIGKMQITTAPSGIREVRVEAPIQELEALLRSLEAGPSSREVVVELPAESQFFMIGEPTLVREADMVRRSLSP